MTPDLCQVLAAVQEQLGEQLDLLDQQGPVYAKAVIESHDRPETLVGPPGPIGMHPLVRKLVRDLVTDELAAYRCYGPRRVR